MDGDTTWLAIASEKENCTRVFTPRSFVVSSILLPIVGRGLEECSARSLCIYLGSRTSSHW